MFTGRCTGGDSGDWRLLERQHRPHHTGRGRAQVNRRRHLQHRERRGLTTERVDAACQLARQSVRPATWRHSRRLRHAAWPTLQSVNVRPPVRRFCSFVCLLFFAEVLVHCSFVAAEYIWRRTTPNNFFSRFWSKFYFYFLYLEIERNELTQCVGYWTSYELLLTLLPSSFFDNGDNLYYLLLIPEVAGFQGYAHIPWLALLLQ